MQTSAPSTSALAHTFRERLKGFLAPLLTRLDEQLDSRLVGTLSATVEVLLQNRYRSCGLLLSELGAFLTCPEKAAAGTKRLSNLLRSQRWSADLLSDYLWEHAQQKLCDWICRQREPLAIWDESVWEKPESIALEGLGSVVSAKAKRLKRIRKGYYNPPGGPPVIVPGLNWLGLLLSGAGSPPVLAAMRWWTNRGERAEEKRNVELSLLEKCAAAWGKTVLHVFDRGYAGAPWLEALARNEARFVMRWKKGNHLQDLLGNEAPAWMLVRGKKTRQSRMVADHTGQRSRRGVLAVPVRHPSYPGPLWLVVSRRGKGHEPWYLLTNELADTPAAMWRIVFAYARRWQIEMAWRFGKTELVMQSPRLWFWDNRLKLLLIVSLVYAFLLSLLDPLLKPLRDILLKRFCPRTGKRSRASPTPLYRLRTALSYLWLCTASPFLALRQSSG
ncbi:MAG: transposase [Solirubrobacterales bacterium]